MSCKDVIPHGLRLGHMVYPDQVPSTGMYWLRVEYDQEGEKRSY